MTPGQIVPLTFGVILTVLLGLFFLLPRFQFHLFLLISVFGFLGLGITLMIQTLEALQQNPFFMKLLIILPIAGLLGWWFYRKFEILSLEHERHKAEIKTAIAGFEQDEKFARGLLPREIRAELALKQQDLEHQIILLREQLEQKYLNAEKRMDLEKKLAHLQKELEALRG